MDIYYGKPFDRNAYVYKDTKILHIFTGKNTSKITKRVQKLLTLMLRSQTLTSIPPLVLNQ